MPDVDDVVVLESVFFFSFIFLYFSFSIRFLPFRFVFCHSDSFFAIFISFSFFDSFLGPTSKETTQRIKTKGRQRKQ